MNSDVKNKQISLMDCCTFEVKVVSNKLNRLQKESVNGIFREAKWIRNAYITDKNNCKGNFKTVPVKAGDSIEIRELFYIGSQMKQSVIKQINSEIRSLSSHKKKGDKIGRLKSKSVCNSVNLKQYGVTYDIDFDNNRIRVQNIKKPIYVKGLKQIPSDAEICNAKMVRKASGLYFYVTCYIPKKQEISTGKRVGVDFGIRRDLF